MNRLVVAWACAWLIACNGDDGVSVADGGVAGRKPFTLEEARNPETCKDCHFNHYTEWASSMHAYAAKDPVFVAMNKRGQRETQGALGDFCVNCHAPMAVRDKQTHDGLNLDELPEASKGVTCYFCHNTIAVDGDHNNMLRLANDITMRGPVHDAKQPGVHRSAYSALLDDRQSESSTMCGGCHDIVTPAGVHLERTFEEFKTSLNFSGRGALSCAACHMNAIENQTIADDPPSHVPANRTHHLHLWPAVDVALTDFPNREAQKRAVECELAAGTDMPLLKPNSNENGTQLGAFYFAVETSAGHRQPSGAAQDRRMWFEIQAFDSQNTLLESSGVIADGELEEKPKDDPQYDDRLWLFRDRAFGRDGQPVHMFWDAAPSAQYPNGYDEKPTILPTPMLANSMQHWASKTYVFPITGTAPGATARVEARMRMRPMGMDVLQDLVDSGDLDPAIMAEVPTFTLAATERVWKVADGNDEIITGAPDTLNCPNSYMCLLRPGSSYCNESSK